MPLYTFLTVPSVAAFGLNEFSTRLPNAILGTLSVVVIYLLCLKLKTDDYRLATIAALLFAISPWHLPLSRGAFEANLITFFIPLALVLFFSKKLALSTLFFVFSLYSYHSARIIAPLTLIGLFIIYRPKFSKSWLVLLLAIPALYSFIFANQRAVDVSIFHPDDNWASMAAKRLELIDAGWPPVLARLASNKFSHVPKIFIKNYFSYFTFDFLFTKGPAEATYGMLPGTGVLSWIQMPLLFGSLVLMPKNRYRGFLVIMLCLLISPIPAALSKGPGFAANRAAFMSIPLTVLSAFGLQYFLSSKTKKYLLVLLVISNSIAIYVYFKKSPEIHARSMGYGFSQLTQFLNINQDLYDEIRISRSLSEAHIYYAFYSQLDPKMYQSYSNNWPDFESQGFRFLDQYDGYYLQGLRFGDLNYERQDPGNILYIGRPSDFPDSTQTVPIASYPDTQSAIVSTGREVR